MAGGGGQAGGQTQGRAAESPQAVEKLYLIAGLGNPGSEYARTRHNAGFLVVERLAERWGATWQTASRFAARLARVTRGERTVWLCLPQTYMNASGEAVAAVRAYYRVALERVLVVTDDADLPLGELRLRPRGSSGGHHGLESVERHLGTRDYARLRLGIGRGAHDERQITHYVLGRFSVEEAEQFAAVRERAVRQIECWLDEGIQQAMNRFNGAASVPATKTDV